MTRKKLIFTVLYFEIVTIGLLICTKQGILYCEKTSGNGVAYEQKVESVAYGYALEQSIVPQYDKIDSIWVYVDLSERQQERGSLRATLTDNAGNTVATATVAIAQMPSYGWCEVPLEAETETGRTYTLALETVDCPDFGPRLSVFPAEVAASPEEECGSLLYAGIPLSYVGSEIADAVLRLNIIYSVPAPWYSYVLYYLCAGVLWSVGMNIGTENIRRAYE